MQRLEWPEGVRKSMEAAELLVAGFFSVRSCVNSCLS